ncbi:MAG: phenylacetate--CoA ligase family protein [Anaerolineaceae bacterium]
MSKLIDSFYFNSPVWLQQFSISLWGYFWYRQRFSHKFHEYVKEIHNRDYWTLHQFHEYQLIQLTNLIDSAWNSSFYKDVFSRSGITKKMNSWEVYSRLPVLSKETLRKSSVELLTQKKIPRNTKIFKSSGTTGTPTKIFYTPEFLAFDMAVSEARNINVGGANYRDRRVMFGVRKVCNFDQKKPPFWRFSPAENMAYCSIYHLSEKFIPYYLDFLNQYKPKVIMGYPSALYTIARNIKDNNQTIPPAKMIVTTSETVTHQVRELLEEVWGCKLFDRYGAVESCLFVGQCEKGKYHTSPDIGIIEIVDPEGLPCKQGVLGEIICTGLHNTLQPLLRYKIGDVGRWSENQQCECGRLTPIMEGIDGRIEDMCITPDGREMLRFDTIFKGIETIKQAQIIQEKMDLFRILIIPTYNFTKKDEDKIKQNAKNHLGELSVIVDKVDVIPLSASGKFRSVICKLSLEEKNRLRNKI